jgi:hypothetical protein
MRNTRKEIGKYIGTFTARGKLSEDDSEQGRQARVRLFDGKFDTAFKVREFHAWGASTGGNTTPDVVGKLSTSPNVETGPGDFFNANDSLEIAWSQSVGSLDAGAGGGFGESIIDPDNLVVEDLWVSVRGVSDANGVNYMIVMDKYDITETLGAVSMAKERARDSGSEWRTP